MGTWAEVEEAAGDLAARVKGRFEAHGLGILATIRPSGFPRTSGIEPLFAGELWLGMMPDSRKGADLLSNPRLSLHSATIDKEVKQGDARVAGFARRVEEPDLQDQFRSEFAARTGHRPPPPQGPMILFRVDVTEISFLRPNRDHLVIEWWREGTGVQSVKRY